MSIDRLSALDESFLRVETDDSHMHVGWTLLLEGEPPDLAELRALIGGRLDLLPRFRRRVLCSRARLHDPIWVDDEAFDIARHVRSAELPWPGRPADLRALAGGLLSHRLDRRHPLWRLVLVGGLQSGGFAIVGQAHHALVDGVAAAELALLLLDLEPDGRSGAEPATRPGACSRWTPSPPPPLVARIAQTVAERVALARTATRLASRAAFDPSVVAELTTPLKALASALSTVGRPAPRTALNGRIGADRAVAFAELPLERARELGAACQATVNDIVLATATLALGAALRRRGEDHPWLRTLIPVSTRRDGDADRLGNRISFVFVDLPIAERDPRAIVSEIRRQMGAHKTSGAAGALDGALRAAAATPLAVRDAIAWLATRPEAFNVVVSNIPGPRTPLYLLGRPARRLYPAVPLIGHHGVSVGVLSYCGVLHVGLYGSPEVVPELDELGNDFTRAFDALRVVLGPARRPRAPVSSPA